MHNTRVLGKGFTAKWGAPYIESIVVRYGSVEIPDF